MEAEKILIVEDNNPLREGLKVLLNNAGYIVFTAGNGKAALEVMENITPNLVLTDILMPVMDGFEFFNQVRMRNEWLSIPIIFMTAKQERSFMMRGKQLGADDYLIKPVDSPELLTTIRSRLERNRELQYVQMQESYESSLIMLASAIEAREKCSERHIRAVSDISIIISKQMGWTNDHQNNLKFGAILHDIGKIYLREDLLTKKGKLIESEWEEIKQHPIVGAEMLHGIPLLAPATSTILYHHERWDGKGYPEGLAGNDIPIDARIVAVADAFSAMVSERVYRPAYPIEIAYQEIIGNSGRRYDPTIVTAFRYAWDQGEIQRVILPDPVDR